MLIVIDTNVISAALWPDGVPAKLLAKALTDHQLVLEAQPLPNWSCVSGNPGLTVTSIWKSANPFCMTSAPQPFGWRCRRTLPMRATAAMQTTICSFIHAAIAAEEKLLITWGSGLAAAGRKP